MHSSIVREPAVATSWFPLPSPACHRRRRAPPVIRRAPGGRRGYSTTASPRRVAAIQVDVAASVELSLIARRCPGTGCRRLASTHGAHPHERGSGVRRTGDTSRLSGWALSTLLPPPNRQTLAVTAMMASLVMTDLLLVGTKWSIGRSRYRAVPLRSGAPATPSLVASAGVTNRGTLLAPSKALMTLAFNDIRFAVRGLLRSPLFSIVADPVAGARHRRQHRDLHADRSGSCCASCRSGRRTSSSMLYQQRRAQRQQHGSADALVSDLPGVFRSAPSRWPRCCAGASAEASVSIDNQTERARSRDGLGQLLHDARREARRSAACSTREEDDQVYEGHPVVVLSYDYWDRRFARDPAVVGKKILVNNYPMTIVGVSAQRVCRPRPGAVAADPRADPDEAGRSCPSGAGCTWTIARDALGPGVRAA